MTNVPTPQQIVFATTAAAYQTIDPNINRICTECNLTNQTLKLQKRLVTQGQHTILGMTIQHTHTVLPAIF